MVLLPFLAMICYVGESVRDAFLNLGDSVYGVPWYVGPASAQKMFPLMLMHAEKPVSFESVGGLDCSHETFKVVN